MNGIELFKKLKGMQDNPNSKKPCIILTANAVAGAREVYLQEGFDDYMSKPLDGKALEELMMKYLPRNKYDAD
jgi:CheY-like chemotaxis protein